MIYVIRLIIADDEKYDRESITSILNDAFEEKIEISEASNGRELIEISERIRPDIIITDIKMPGINGLKAIEEIKKSFPNIYLIILTAYDYFDFAREAVKSNVKEYILKPFSQKELIEKVGKGIDFIGEEKKKRKLEIETQEKLYNLMPILENELSFSIINESLPQVDYETYMKYIDMDFQNTFSMIVHLKKEINYENKDDIRFDEEMKINIGEHIKEYIKRKYKTIASYRFTKDIVYFVQFNKIEEHEELKLYMINLAVEIRREIKKVFYISVKIGIGTCYDGIKKMHKSYEEANECIDYITDKEKVVYFGDINEYLVKKDFSFEDSKKLEKRKVLLYKTVERYISENLEEEIDLEKVAAQFNLSSFYFSRTFKDIVGYNFSDYVNIIRIKKSKELLKNDSISIKEICYKVGYSDPNYFSKVFKKYEGITPSEYKLNLSK